MQILFKVFVTGVLILTISIASSKTTVSISQDVEKTIITSDINLSSVIVQTNNTEEMNVTLLPRYSEENISFPYGITLNKQKKEDESFTTEHTYIFMQNGKEVDRFTDYRISEYFDGDVDKDGIRDLIFLGFSGGSHCCFTLTFLHIEPQMKKLIHLDLKNSDIFELKDLDGDGKQEWIMYDDRYSYFGSFCFACSPWVQIVANYERGKLTLRPDLMRQYTPMEPLKLKASSVILDNHGYLQLNNNYAPEVISTFLYYFYTGETQKALNVINTYLIFEERGVKLLFLESLTKTMSKSVFWDQLRKLNYLYNKESVETGRYPMELFDADSVAQKFFEVLGSGK